MSPSILESLNFKCGPNLDTAILYAISKSTSPISINDLAEKINRSPLANNFEAINPSYLFEHLNNHSILSDLLISQEAVKPFREVTSEVIRLEFASYLQGVVFTHLPGLNPSHSDYHKLFIAIIIRAQFYFNSASIDAINSLRHSVYEEINENPFISLKRLLHGIGITLQSISLEFLKSSEYKSKLASFIDLTCLIGPSFVRKNQLSTDISIGLEAQAIELKDSKIHFITKDILGHFRSAQLVDYGLFHDSFAFSDNIATNSLILLSNHLLHVHERIGSPDHDTITVTFISNDKTSIDAAQIIASHFPYEFQSLHLSNYANAISRLPANTDILLRLVAADNLSDLTASLDRYLLSQVTQSPRNVFLQFDTNFFSDSLPTFTLHFAKQRNLSYIWHILNEDDLEDKDLSFFDYISLSHSVIILQSNPRDDDFFLTQLSKFRGSIPNFRKDEADADNLVSPPESSFLAAFRARENILEFRTSSDRDSTLINYSLLDHWSPPPELASPLNYLSYATGVYKLALNHPVDLLLQCVPLSSIIRTIQGADLIGTAQVSQQILSKGDWTCTQQPFDPNISVTQALYTSRPLLHYDTENGILQVLNSEHQMTQIDTSIPNIYEIDSNLILTKYLEQYLSASIFLEQREYIWPNTPHRMLLDVFIPLPSLEVQKAQHELSSISWGLLPLRTTGSIISKEWVENFVDSILIHSKDDLHVVYENITQIFTHLHSLWTKSGRSDLYDSYSDLIHSSNNLYSSVSVSHMRLEKALQSNLQDHQHVEIAKDLCDKLRNYETQIHKLHEQYNENIISSFIEVEVINIKDIIDMIIRNYSGDSRVHIQSSITDTNGLAWANGNKLFEIGVNIINNAIIHGRRTSGSIDIFITDNPMDHLSEAEISIKEYYSLYFFNNGEPLTHSKRTLIQKSRSAGQNQSSGLGLYMIQKWVEYMGGRFEPVGMAKANLLEHVGHYMGVEPIYTVVWHFELKRAIIGKPRNSVPS